MPPQQGQCPFCQLISNPDQLMTVGETDNFYAWLEVNPRAKGHTMIVPKEHEENVLELSADEWNEAFRLTREVVERAKKGLDADGASITVNIEEAGGQMLPHAYIQVFPRFESDENAGTPTGAIFPQQEELQNQLDSIQSSMANVSVDIGGESHEAHPESQNFKDESEIDKMLSDSITSGPGDTTQEQRRQRQEAQGESPGSEDTESQPSPEPREDSEDRQEPGENNGKDISDLDSTEMLNELVQRYGGPEALLRSKEFEAIVGQSDMELRDEPKGTTHRSVDWR